MMDLYYEEMAEMAEFEGLDDEEFDEMQANLWEQFGGNKAMIDDENNDDDGQTWIYTGPKVRNIG